MFPRGTQQWAMSQDGMRGSLCNWNFPGYHTLFMTFTWPHCTVNSFRVLVEQSLCKVMSHKNYMFYMKNCKCNWVGCNPLCFESITLFIMDSHSCLLAQGLPDYNLWTKSRQWPLFANIFLGEQSHTHIFTCLWLLLPYHGRVD